MNQIFVNIEVIQQIKMTICSETMEAGGILGTKDGIISSFYEDKTAEVSYGSYQPDIASCEKVINDEWNKSGILFCGFVHTHRADMKPSEADIQYYQAIFEAMNSIGYEQTIYLFIADCNAKTKERLHAYCGKYDDQNTFSVYPLLVIIK